MRSSGDNQRHAMIQQVTGVSRQEAPIIERLMGESIRHSTLDWLSPEEFANTAREAYQLFNLAPSYFHSQQACLAAAFKRMQAEKRLERTQAKSDPQTVNKAREHLALCRRQEDHHAGICQRIGKAFFPSENA